MKPIRLILTCEHGTNVIPTHYQALFNNNPSVLSSSRAMDYGTKALSQYLSEQLKCDILNASVSRLLIDTNRNLHHPNCLSEFTKKLPAWEKQDLIKHYYQQYRKSVAQKINQILASQNQVLHVSVHSFLFNEKSCEDVVLSLLYDTKRHGEKEVARLWRNVLSSKLKPLDIRLNYPYRKRPESLVASLKKQYSEKDYLGIELECNQNYIQDKQSFDQIKHVLGVGLEQLMEMI